MCPSIILSEKGNTLISYCTQCKKIYLWHNNIIISLHDDAFLSLKKHAFSTDFEDKMYPFPDGEHRLLLSTPHPDINFTFTETEWESFLIAMEEASYMQEVYHLLY